MISFRRNMSLKWIDLGVESILTEKLDNGYWDISDVR